MISPRKKRIKGIIIVLLLVGALCCAIVLVNLIGPDGIITMDEMVNKSTDGGNLEYKVDRIGEIALQVADNLEEAHKTYYSQVQAGADIVAEGLRDAARTQGDRVITKLNYGGVVKIENGEIVIPQGMRNGIRKYVDQITGTKGHFLYDTITMDGVRKDTVVFSKIEGPYYYVEIISGDKLDDFVDEYADYWMAFITASMSYELSLTVICPDREHSRYFFNLPDELVFTSDDEYLDGLENMPTSTEEILRLNGAVSVDENGYAKRYIVREFEPLDSLIIIEAPCLNSILQVIDQTKVGIYAILTLCLVYVVWITSVYKDMFRGNLTEEKKRMYSPLRLRIISVSYGILSVLLVFGISNYARTLNTLYRESNNLASALSMLDARIETVKMNRKSISQLRKGRYVDYAERVAGLIEKRPEYNDKEKLRVLNEIIGTEYIMIYDASGREIGTSSNYINMELGDPNADKPLSSADFRRILKGVPAIYHGPFVDEVTGRKLEQIGVRMNDTQNGGYGVLLIAIEPNKNETDSETKIDSIMHSLSSSKAFCFSIDTGKMEIKNSGLEELYPEYPISYLGIKESSVRGNMEDFIKIQGISCYCVTKAVEDGKTIYYFCEPSRELFANGMKFAISCAIGQTILFVILSLYLLYGYTDRTLEKIEESRKSSAESTEADEEASEQNKKRPEQEYRSRLGAYLYQMLINMTPERKAWNVCRILLFIELLALFTEGLTGNGNSLMVESRDRVIGYILEGNWERGVNLFSITAIILLIIGILIAMVIVRFIFNTIGRMLNRRGKTICKLLSNLISYISILVLVYYALSYIGVDTNAILASVGVLGIGISMGARDLIADVFAGVSTIVEGEYQVGDIVSIDGYRGMVDEIGVRSTRLIGRGGNIKVVGNKDIKSVVNHTKLNSWVAVTVKVDVNYPLKDVETILTEVLPRIGERTEQIISGPYYKGVLSVEGGGVVLSVIAECSEDDYHKVERILIREIIMTLREQNVPLK